MKIAINCCFFVPKGGGIKEYIYNLTNSIAENDQTNEYILYVHKDALSYAKENLPQRMRIKTIPFNVEQKIKRSLFEQSFWYKEEKIEQFDVFHSPFFHSPRFRKAKVVVTVHDLRFYRFPKSYTFLRYHFLKYVVPRTLKRADQIITISNFTKDEILKAYDIDYKRITTIYEAVNRDRFNKSLITNYESETTKKLAGETFLLSVGHLEPRKNYERLILSFTKIKKEFPNIKLVIVGKKGHDYNNVLSMINENQDIIYLDFIEHDLLLWLYDHALLMVFPSIYEGFGFPVLEAACFETVSVISNCSSLPEIGGNSSFYFDPFDVKAISITIINALLDENSINEKKMLLTSNVDRFSWDENALQTISLYNKINIKS